MTILCAPSTDECDDQHVSEASLSVKGKYLMAVGYFKDII